MTTKTCPNCGQKIKHATDKKGATTYHGYWCESCGKKGKGATEAKAWEAFTGSTPTKQATTNQQTALALPDSPDRLPAYVTQNMGEITQLTAPFVSHDRPAMSRLVKNNVRYALTLKGDAWNKIWGNPDGQASVVRGFEEAMALGAELGKMGDLVPFGEVCEFIPAIEAYEFALTTGNSAPFDWVNVEPVYQNDQVEIGRKDGNFTIEFKKILPNRGKVIAVAVYGLYKRLTTPITIGELYDAERLIEKAEAHSPSYRSYIQKLNLYERAKSERGEEVDSNGRYYVLTESVPEDDKFFEQNKVRFEEAEKAGLLKGTGKNQYAEVDIPKRGGGTFTKKIYRKDIEGGATERMYRDTISNPYDGPDRPEMLRKAAGKSFLGKYVKVRNSVAAMDEMRKQPDTVEQALDGALDAAFSQFEGGGGEQPQPRQPQPPEYDDVTDAEFSVEPDDDGDMETGEEAGQDDPLPETPGPDAATTDTTEPKKQTVGIPDQELF